MRLVTGAHGRGRARALDHAGRQPLSLPKQMGIPDPWRRGGGARVREDSITSIKEEEVEEDEGDDTQQEEPVEPSAMEVDQDDDAIDDTAAAFTDLPAPPPGVPQHQQQPCGPAPVPGMHGPERGMNDPLWAAGLSRDQLVEAASHIRRELVAADIGDRTKNGWRGPTPPGWNINYTLRRNFRWWFRLQDGGTRYKDQAWKYDNSISHWRKTRQKMDHDIGMEAPPTPCNEEGSNPGGARQRPYSRGPEKPLRRG